MKKNAIGVLFAALCFLTLIALSSKVFTTVNSSITDNTVARPFFQQQQNQSQPEYLTYTGPLNSYTLSYPSNWHVEEKPPITNFDKYETEFTTQYGNPITISVYPSKSTDIEDFKLDSEVVGKIASAGLDLQGFVTEGSGFGYYSMGGYETYGMPSIWPHSGYRQENFDANYVY